MPLILKHLYDHRLQAKGLSGDQAAAANPVSDSGTLYKMSGFAKAVDSKTKTIRVTASDETVDRYGDVILTSAWENEKNKKEFFQANNVLLWAHNRDYAFGLKPLGLVENPTYERSFDVDANFKGADAYKEAEEIWKLYELDVLKAFSVGFIPVTVKFEPVKLGQDGYTYLECNLLELSAVPIPANPNALKKAFEGGYVSEETLEKAFKPFLDGMIKNKSLFLPAEYSAKDFSGLDFILKDHKGEEVSCSCKSKSVTKTEEVNKDIKIKREGLERKQEVKENKPEEVEVKFECLVCESDKNIKILKSDYEKEENQISFLGTKIFNATCPDCKSSLKDIEDIIKAHNLV